MVCGQNKKFMLFAFTCSYPVSGIETVDLWAHGFTPLMQYSPADQKVVTSMLR